MVKYQGHWRNKLLKYGTRWVYSVGPWPVARVFLDSNVRHAVGEPPWRVMFDLPGLSARNINFSIVKDAREYVERVILEWFMEAFNVGSGSTKEDKGDSKGTPPTPDVRR